MQRRLPELAALAALAASTLACPKTTAGSVGAVLGQSKDDGRLFVRAAPGGMAASRAGLAEGDEVLTIDGRDVRSMSPNDVHVALEGEVGTSVKLTVLRRGRIERLTVERAPLGERK
jgi:carboxyl-terminal processing protease